MGIGSGYVLLLVELQLGVPSFMGCGGITRCSEWKDLLLRVVGISEMLVKTYGGKSRGYLLLGQMCSAGWKKSVVRMMTIEEILTKVITGNFGQPLTYVRSKYIDQNLEGVSWTVHGLHFYLYLLACNQLYKLLKIITTESNIPA